MHRTPTNSKIASTVSTVRSFRAEFGWRRHRGSRGGGEAALAHRPYRPAA